MGWEKLLKEMQVYVCDIKTCSSVKKEKAGFIRLFCYRL